MASCTRAMPTLRSSPCGSGRARSSIPRTCSASRSRVTIPSSRLRATLPQAGYGQGDVVATPLRMARVAAAIASSGMLRDIRVVDRSARTSTHTQVLLTPGAAATLGRYLRDAVLSGTGRSLRGHPWRIAGKTGTAEVHDAQSHAWFVGYAPYGPAEKRVAFAVLIENAGYGGAAAAPAAGEIVTAAAASGLVEIRWTSSRRHESLNHSSPARRSRRAAVVEVRPARTARSGARHSRGRRRAHGACRAGHACVPVQQGQGHGRRRLARRARPVRRRAGWKSRRCSETHRQGSCATPGATSRAFR